MENRHSHPELEPHVIEFTPHYQRDLRPVDPFAVKKTEQPQKVKAKVYQNDPHHINDHLIFSNASLGSMDLDVIRQNESKLMEEEYRPKEWSVSKLNIIKKSSSLDEQIIVNPNSIKVQDHVILMDIETPAKKTSSLEVSFFTGGIVKLKCINPVNPSKFSFEIIEKPPNLTPCPIGESLSKEEQQITITLPDAQIRVLIKFSPFNVVILSKDGESLIEMNTQRSLKFDKNITADFRFHSTYVYGIPEHALNLLLEDTKASLPYRLYNNDVFGYLTGLRQALYGSIPIMIGRKAESSTFMSLFWENTSETYIDIHKTDKISDTFWLSERGNLECYLFVSYSARAHYESFANLTGKAAMPQYFSLGYHQCRYSYNDEQDLLHVNEKFNEHEIPCDTLTLDIDHTDGFRYFTWDLEMFPDPVFMQDVIAKDGRKLITIADPHIRASEDYHVYNGAIEKELCVLTPDRLPFVGVCFPGDCIWIDFLNEEARDFWSSRYSYENYKLSTSSLFAWNDMNEPSVFEHKDKAMPKDNLHCVKTLAAPDKPIYVEHREVHNIYGYCMHKATYNGILKRNKDQNIRPHVLSRAFYAGSQKWSTIWTGDTLSTWEHLKYTVPMMLSMAMCGLSFIGGDVGGFLGNPEPELNVRWTQLGSFMPYFRAHCDKRYDRREPWLNTKEYYEIIKHTIKEKYKFLSYWYTCFEDYCRTGIPAIRPIWFDLDKITDLDIMKEDERFMVGESLMVVPIVEPGIRTLKTPLKGLPGRWYDYYHKIEAYPEDEIHTGLERIGVFVKGGHIIPQFEYKPGMKSSKEVMKADILVFIALDENERSKGVMYFDDGETFDFQKGVRTFKTIEFANDTLTWTDTGNFGYVPNNRVTRVKLMGHSKKFTHAYLEVEGGDKQEAVIDYPHGFVRAHFVAPTKQNWKLVFSLQKEESA